MDAEPLRRYCREWKRNKPYLSKSTSLPLLRLSPQDRAIFICKLCGFSNLLVPMCLWCCWTSADARRDFEASARRTLRRAARSAPRLLHKPILSTSSHKVREVGVGKHQCSDYSSKSPSRRCPHTSTITTVTPSSTLAHPPPRAKQHRPPWFSISVQKNRGRQEVISEPRRAQAHQCQGWRTESGINDCGTGPGGNNCGPTKVTIKHSHLRPNFLSRAGYTNKTKGATGGSSRSTPTPTSGRLNGPQVPHSPPPRLPLFKKSSFLPPRFPVRAVLATILPSTRRRRSGVATASFRNVQPLELNTTTPTSIRAMLLDAPATDTPCSTPNATLPSPPTVSTTSHEQPVSRRGEPTTQLDHEICNYVPMDVDVATAIQSDQAAPASRMNQTSTTVEQSFSSDIDLTNNTTMMKTHKKRAPIPSILLQHSSTTDTPIASEASASHIPMITETTSPTATKNNPPPSPVRTLKRKKRLSLIGLSPASSAALAPPDPSLPFSPPPIQTSHSPPQFSPTFPIVTPPDSPSHTCPGNFPPTIVISAPASITSMAIDPSRPIPPPATTPTQTLPRIGTPKRPYYSTVRANNMNNNRPPSSVSYLSTPPASPSSSTFTAAVGGGSRSPTSVGTPGSPDQGTYTTHIDTHHVRRPASMLVDNTGIGAGCDSASAAAKTHRPTSTSAIVTVPPLPPVATSPVPIPIPVQMQMRPSSPVRSILSVMDPAQFDEDDEEDEEHEYNQFGMISSRFGRVLRERRSSNMKEKNARGSAGGGGYSFPLSLSLSLRRKRGRTLGLDGLKSKKEQNATSAMPTLSPRRSYNGICGFGPGRGCSMSGEVEMRMALAERSLNANGGSDNGLEPAFKFQENQRPSYDAEGLVCRTSNGKKLIRTRSNMGLSSNSLATSPPSPSSKPKIGSRLKEISVNFFGKFQDANRSQ